MLIAASQCTAQVRSDNYHGHGYAYVAPAGFSAGGNTLTAIALGAGGEAMLWLGPYKDPFELMLVAQSHPKTFPFPATTPFFGAFSSGPYLCHTSEIVGF
jgi:hypothetical protein